MYIYVKEKYMKLNPQRLVGTIRRFKSDVFSELTECVYVPVRGQTVTVMIRDNTVSTGQYYTNISNIVGDIRKLKYWELV